MKSDHWFILRNRFASHLRIAGGSVLFIAAAAMAFIAVRPSSAVMQSAATYDINTLAGKVASVNGTQGLGIRFSAFIEQEAEEPTALPPGPLTPITPTHVLTSPLDGTMVTPPAVTVNQDTAAATQNETPIAVDPNNSNRIVAGANDYVTRTWPCTVNGTPCSALGDGYSGTYFSNNGGSTWCCNSNPNSNYVPTTDPTQIGTQIPGVEHLVAGQYDAGGDPAVAFDSQGHVFYCGLGFDRTAPASTVAVNKGTFDGGGNLTWGLPTFINPSTSPSTLNDKPWIAVDTNATSPFKDRIYVTWTRFLFNAHNGSYVQSPIFFVYSTNGGATFSTPTLIAGNVLYSQGSRPVVGPDGTLYVFWNGSTRLASLNSTYMVKSSDGGATWSPPLSVATMTNIPGVRNTVFRVNSYPAAAAAPNGDVYVTWNTEVDNTTPIYTGDPGCAYFIPGNHVSQCHSVAVYSKSTDAGQTWSDPAPVFVAGNRAADGYPVTQPTPDPNPNGCQAANGCDGSTFNAPSPTGPIEDVFPVASVAANGDVYLGAYRGTTFLRGRHVLRVLRHRRAESTVPIWADTFITPDLITSFRTLQRTRRTPSARIPLTPAISSAAASSVITPTSPPARTTSSTPSGPIRIMSRTSCGGTVSSSYPRRFTSRTSSPILGTSEAYCEQDLTKGPPVGGPFGIPPKKHVTVLAVMSLVDSPISILHVLDSAGTTLGSPATNCRFRQCRT